MFNVEKSALQNQIKANLIVVQSLSCVLLFVTPWTAACQASLSFTISWSLLRLMSIELVMPFNHLILCCLLLLPPSTFPSIRVFPNESPLHIRGPKYWSFSFSTSTSSEQADSLPSTGWISMLIKRDLFCYFAICFLYTAQLFHPHFIHYCLLLYLFLYTEMFKFFSCVFFSCFLCGYHGDQILKL